MFGNWLKTTVLMAAIVALFGAIGSYLGGTNGMIVALIFGGAMKSRVSQVSPTLTFQVNSPIT